MHLIRHHISMPFHGISLPGTSGESEGRRMVGSEKGSYVTGSTLRFRFNVISALARLIHTPFFFLLLSVILLSILFFNSTYTYLSICPSLVSHLGWFSSAADPLVDFTGSTIIVTGGNRGMSLNVHVPTPFTLPSRLLSFPKLRGCTAIFLLPSKSRLDGA
jgi:hypothetical protein